MRFQMDPDGLTARQRRVLEFIRAHQREHGYTPSTREIQRHFGYASQTSAMAYLRALERRNLIRRAQRKSRAVTVAGMSTGEPVPLLGHIPAGMPSGAGDAPPEALSLDPALFGLKDFHRCFALRARGDSMIGAGIFDGDLVLMKDRPPMPGDIVAALVDGETTLKRYLVRQGTPFLRAENPAYPDLVPAADLTVQGVQVGLVRRGAAA